jgi:hypothetical protein
MGGSYSGGISGENLKTLEERARESLKSAEASSCPHVFISFAFEDINEVNLLRGQAKNENTCIEFDDYSVKEAYESKDADYIKRQIRERIERASVTLVFLSPNSSNSKWVDWEIRESLKQGKGVVGVYSSENPPPNLPSAIREFKIACVKWQHEAIKKAIETASKKR